jgi:hypothetical protein
MKSFPFLSGSANEPAKFAELSGEWRLLQTNPRRNSHRSFAWLIGGLDQAKRGSFPVLPRPCMG